MLASSRLKPVPLNSIACIQWDWLNATSRHLGVWLDVTFVGPALAGKALGVTLQD
jgi:hypothetical protein